MPRTRSLAWSELKIGVLTILAVTIAATTIFMLTGGRGFFWQRYHLKTRFDNVAGLKSGSPVRVAGVEVGTVRSVDDFVGEQVDVELEINKSMRQRITTGSIASLGSVSLLGESAVDITPSTKGTPIPDGGYVQAGLAKGGIADVAAQAQESVAEITKLVTDIRLGKGTIGKLMTDEELYNDLQEFAASAGELTRGLRDGRGTLGKLMTDPKAANALEASLTNVQRVTEQINAGQGSLGKLVKDDAFANSLNKATASLQEMTAKLNRGEGTAGKLLTDQALYNKLDAVTGRFDELLTKLNAGEGTAGQLLKDKQLYENMNGTVAELRTLLSAIEKDPKKYLNVRISVF
jgi:phospholipid/cholesterol/gamma-HCH transport system substrate-binding protein